MTLDLDAWTAAASVKWERIPRGALNIGCKGCVAATSVWCASCPVRRRWQERHENLEMPKARLR